MRVLHLVGVREHTCGGPGMAWPGTAAQQWLTLAPEYQRSVKVRKGLFGLMKPLWPAGRDRIPTDHAYCGVGVILVGESWIEGSANRGSQPPIND